MLNPDAVGAAGVRTVSVSSATPRVSICVPNLNTRPFLPERFETILAQSLPDWELLVYDSYSNDGAWEYIQELERREPRMHAWQGPRQGTPGSWTPCVRAARGEYVYIATSDDTMPPDCLEKLVAALDAHPECDLAHCQLRAIDEHGAEVTPVHDWWMRGSSFAVSSGPLLSSLHVRHAPFDGLLHLLGGSVYTSITQLLIRRSLFDRIGFFESTWGSIGDFNWGMRAGLVANSVHVPDTWGGWRLHSTQATAAVSLESAEHARKIAGMIRHAVDTCEHLLPPAVRRALASHWLREAEELRSLVLDISCRREQSLVQRRAYVAGRLCSGSAPAWEYVTSRVLGRRSTDWVHRRLREAGYGSSLVPSTRIPAYSPVLQ
jgi:glycosyltransferase involved in cell wall biosynthesis